MFKEEIYHQTQSETLLMTILPLVPDLRCIGGTGFPGYLKHLPALQITDSDWKLWLARAPFQVSFLFQQKELELRLNNA